MKIHWAPQPKQSKALASNADEILYGGARGGGKTDCGQAWCLYDSDNPLYRALAIRKNATDLADWIDRAKRMFKPTGAEFIGDSFKFPKGGILRTGHLKDEDAFTKYQGHEYQKILIEELSQIPREKDYLKLIASCRSTVAGIHAQVFCTTNPDEPGLEWIKERWGIPDIPDFNTIYQRVMQEKGIDGNPIRRKLEFVPAKIEDNPKLTNADPGYIAFLESLRHSDPYLYEAWRNGLWGGYQVEGAYYASQVREALAKGRIIEVPYEPMLDVYTWCDLGMADSFSIGYFQFTGAAWRMIDYDEFEGEGLGQAIQRMRSKGYRYAEHYAPHDIEVRELTADGKSRKEIAERLGVDYNVCPRLDVADGINAVRMRFNTLWFDKEKCSLFIKKISKYHKEFDEKRGIWKNTPYHDGNSHAADMLRYWAVTPFRGQDNDMAARVLQNRINQPNMK